ncbi:MAG: hypothetical protein ALMCE001_19590 [Methanocorpusculum sp. MCE]|nr:MAG: hypothetical protein ALMCE001_19590 [Methanocorpusculum sp. MCE]
MNICRGGFNASNKIVRRIHDGMKFIAIVHFAVLGHDFSIFIPSCFCLISSRRVFLTMTGFSIHKRCILNHTLFNFQTFQVKLSLKLLPDHCINARFGHALPK